jgi:uncharacterized membrane protein
VKNGTIAMVVVKVRLLAVSPGCLHESARPAPPRCCATESAKDPSTSCLTIHGRYHAIRTACSRPLQTPRGADTARKAFPLFARHDAHAPLPPSSVRATRWLAVGSLVGLIVLGLAWELWLAPLRPGGSLLALKVLPLVVPLAGLYKNRMYTYRWVSLMIWLYFTEGVVRAWSDT